MVFGHFLACINRKARTSHTAWLGVFLAWTALSAEVQAAGIGCLPEQESGYAKPELQNRDSVVVFLHGLHGDARTTWSTSNMVTANTAWPCLVKSDSQQFPATNAYLVKYRSVVAGMNPTTGQIARDLKDELTKEGVLGHANITLVAHSMGGIVLARLLTENGLLTDEQRRRIRLVMFVGTPAQPTDAAAFCQALGINSQCDELLDAQGMADLWARWDTLATKPKVWCLAEGDDTAGWIQSVLGWSPRVVPPAAAHRPCKSGGQVRTVIGLNHWTLAKPESRARRPHVDLQVAFAACVRPHLGRVKLADAEQPYAARLQPWFNALTLSLNTPGNDWRQTLMPALTLQTSRYFLPQAGTASLDEDQYDRLNAGSFAAELERVLRPVILQGRFAWVRPIDQLAGRIADGRMDSLIAQLRSSAELQAGDQLAALPVWRGQPDVQWLFALRPLPQGFGLLGVLGVPVRSDCTA